MRSAPPPSRPRINFQAQADELGDNYFVSFAQLRRRSGEHWTFHAVCVGLLAALAWQARRFKRDYVAHSFWTILDGFLMLALLTALLALLLPRQRDPSESSLPSTMLPHEATIFQKGRLPIVSEFRHFVRGNSEWWVRTVAGLLARYIEKPDDSSDSSDDSSDDSDRGGGGYSEEEATRVRGADNLEVFHRVFVPLEWTVPHHRPDNLSYAKLICDKKDDLRVIGLHFCGPNAGEVTQGWALAMKCGATYDDFFNTVGIHPTTAEELTILSVTKASGEDAEGGSC